jgi:hypothetical protein
MLAALLVAGCASTKATKEFTQAKASIRAAEEIGADQEPQAAFYLAKAREKFQQGEQLIEENEGEEAVWTLEKAQADADLALAMAREATMRQEAEETRERIQSLMQEAESRL